MLRPHCQKARVPAEGPNLPAIFAVCYGLGLSVGKVCGLGLGLGDVDVGRSPLIVRSSKAEHEQPERGPTSAVGGRHRRRSADAEATPLRPGRVHCGVLCRAPLRVSE